MSDLPLVESRIIEGALASVEIREAEIPPNEIVAWAKMAERNRCAIAIRVPSKCIPPLGYRLNAASVRFDLILNADDEFGFLILNQAASPGYLWRLSGLAEKEAAA